MKEKNLKELVWSVDRCQELRRLILRLILPQVK